MGQEPAHDVGTGQGGPSAELLAAAESLFGGADGVRDPRNDPRKSQELVEFAASEGRGGSPAEFLNMLAELERSSTLQGSRPMLDKAWHTMTTLKAQRAMSALREDNA